MQSDPIPGSLWHSHNGIAYFQGTPAGNESLMNIASLPGKVLLFITGPIMEVRQTHITYHYAPFISSTGQAGFIDTCWWGGDTGLRLVSPSLGDK